MNSKHFFTSTRLRQFPGGLVAALGIAACVSAKPGSDSRHAPALSPTTAETVAIVGLNDLHGAVAPRFRQALDRDYEKPPIRYEVGGLETLGAYVENLREEHGGNLLILDAGDRFAGSPESEADDGRSVADAYNWLQVAAGTVGEADFRVNSRTSADAQSGLSILSKRVAWSRHPIVASNLSTAEGGEIAGLRSRALVIAGRSKVGVVGVLSKVARLAFDEETDRRIRITDPKEAVLREADALRAEGATLVVLLAHLGISCREVPSRPGPQPRLWSSTDPQPECDSAGELARLLKSLPSGTVDLVVSGHSHSPAHHWVAGVPVMQSSGFASQLAVARFTLAPGQDRPDTSLARIEGPLAVCPAIFANQADCDGEREPPSQGRGALATAVFRGRAIAKPPALTRLLKPALARAEEARSRSVGYAAADLTFARGRESPLGNLLADAVREASGADFAIVNPGLTHARIEAGPITLESLHDAIPYDPWIQVATLSGADAKRVFQVAENLSRGYFPVSGVQLTLIRHGADAPVPDLDRDGTPEEWEVSRLAGLVPPIVDSGTYRIALPDYLVRGGDDFDWVAKTVLDGKCAPLSPPRSLRQAIADYLLARGPVNSPDQPLVDPARPRVRFVDKAKETRKRRRS